METMTDIYTCAHCGGTFEKAWSDEEAAAESLSIWGKLDDPTTICDDCWQIVRPDRRPNQADLEKMWQRARDDWEERAGQRLPVA